MLHYANLSFIFLQHSESFDVSHVFLLLTIAELSTLKQVRFFGPPCTIIDNCLHRILVPSEFVGAVIGKKGQTIRNITNDSKVSRYVNHVSAF